MPVPLHSSRPSTRVVAVDVFCGAAGLSYGLKAAGIDVAAGVDADPDCRYPFESNVGAPFFQVDVALLTPAEVAALFPAGCVRVLAGCAPCQPFSAYTAKRRSVDDRWRLLFDFSKIVGGCLPELVTMENVPRLVHMDAWVRFVTELRSFGYHVVWGVVDASRHGVPQSRRRLVLLASRLGPILMPMPSPLPTPTVRDAIASFAPIDAGKACASDPMHRTRALTAPNLARIRASRPAGTWREWPSSMKLACHAEGRGRYPSVYGRMSWDRPSPTVTTQFYGFGNGRFGHPDQDRALSLREGAALQSFPRSYHFLEPGRDVSFVRIGKLIGNAVPPKLAEAIGAAIVNHVAGGSR